MRQYITYVVMAAVLGIASMGYADDKAAGQKNTTPIKIEKAQKSPITVQKTDTYVSKGKSVGAYAEGAVASRATSIRRAKNVWALE